MADAQTLEADERLLPLLERLEQDGALTITRDGEPVATLMSVAQPRLRTRDPAEVQEIVEGIRELRAQIAARGERFTWEEIKQWRDEGRR